MYSSIIYGFVRKKVNKVKSERRGCLSMLNTGESWLEEGGEEGGEFSGFM